MPFVKPNLVNPYTREHEPLTLEQIRMLADSLSGALGGAGVVLPSGALGRQALATARRTLGDPMMQRLVNSPHIYTFERQPIEGPFLEGSSGTAWTAPVGNFEPEFQQWLAAQLPKGTPRPAVVTRLGVADPTSGAIAHETGHALGVERLHRRLFGDAPAKTGGSLNFTPNDLSDVLSQVGGRHADLLADPRVHRFIREGLQQHPRLGDYYAAYRHGSRSPRVGYGELFNDLWTGRQAAKQGAPYQFVVDAPNFTRNWGAALPKIRVSYGPEIESLQATGRLPAGLKEGVAGETPLMQRFSELQQLLKASPTEYRQAAPGAAPNETLGRVLYNWLNSGRR